MNFTSILNKFKSQYVPTVDEKLRITMDGSIAAPHNGAYTYFDKNGELLEIPEELTLDLPVYTISKTIDQIATGDIIRTNTVNSKGHDTWTYHRVIEVKDGKVTTATFGGNTRHITPIKDFFLGTKTINVAINLMSGMLTGTATTPGFNPMMLMLLSKDSSSSKNLLPLMMMQNGGSQMNPMMLMMLMNDGDECGDKDSLSLMLLMQAMNGSINLFGTPVASTTQE